MDFFLTAKVAKEVAEGTEDASLFVFLTEGTENTEGTLRFFCQFVNLVMCQFVYVVIYCSSCFEVFRVWRSWVAIWSRSWRSGSSIGWVGLKVFWWWVMKVSHLKDSF